MALGDVIGGMLSVPNGGSVTLTPPVGERWALTRVMANDGNNGTAVNSAYTRWRIGAVPNQAAPAVSAAAVFSTNGSGYPGAAASPGTIFLDNTNYLGLFCPTGAATYFGYSGIKLN